MALVEIVAKCQGLEAAPQCLYCPGFGSNGRGAKKCCAGFGRNEKSQSLGRDGYIAVASCILLFFLAGVLVGTFWLYRTTARGFMILFTVRGCMISKTGPRKKVSKTSGSRLVAH